MENYVESTGKAISKKLAGCRKLFLVKNSKRRFRCTANLSKRTEVAVTRQTIKEKLSIAELVTKAARPVTQWVQSCYNTPPEEVRAAGFEISGDELGSIVESHDVMKLQFHGEVNGVAEKLSTSTTKGISSDAVLLKKRQGIYGINKFTESKARSFGGSVLEDLDDKILMFLGVCALVSVSVGLATGGWPVGHMMVLDLLRLYYSLCVSNI